MMCQVGRSRQGKKRCMKGSTVGRPEFDEPRVGMCDGKAFHNG